MNQLFSPELIPDYMHAHPEYGVKRILTYTVYRFLSFAGKEDDTLAAYIKETLFPMEDALDFSLIDDYLALDPYFCPVPEDVYKRQLLHGICHDATVRRMRPAEVFLHSKWLQPRIHASGDR